MLTKPTGVSLFYSNEKSAKPFSKPLAVVYHRTHSNRHLFVLPSSTTTVIKKGRAIFPSSKSLTKFRTQFKNSSTNTLKRDSLYIYFVMSLSSVVTHIKHEILTLKNYFGIQKYSYNSSIY